MRMERDFEYRVYGKQELAQLYCPNVTAGRARNKLMGWIAMQPGLVERLRGCGLQKNAKEFTPMQVRLIVEAIGEP